MSDLQRHGQPAPSSPSRQTRQFSSTKPLKKLFIVLAIVIACIACWKAFNTLKPQSVSQTKETNLLTASFFTATTGDRKIELSLPGDIKAFEDSPIYARVDGYVKNWYVDIGSKVDIGQLLVEIDAPELDQQLNQARAKVLQSKAKLDIARITHQRYKGLLKDSAVSQQEVDNFQAEFDAKNSDWVAAQAEVGRLSELTGFKKVYAPYTGTIGARNFAKATTGALINSGSHDPSAWIYRIYRVDPMRVYIAVPQNYLPMIHDGLDAEVLLREYPTRTFHGKVTRNAEALDTQSRTLLVEVQVPNPDGVLRPGMYSTVRFNLTNETPPIVVPQAAIIMGGDGTRIAVVKDSDIIEIRRVQLGRDFGKNVEIVSGAKKGERIVLSPSDLLKDGMQVKTVDLDPKQVVPK